MKNSRPKRWPETIEEALRVHDSVLSAREMKKIKEMRVQNLSSLQNSVDEMICREFGLRRGNDALLTATLEVHALLGAKTIVREYWDHLNRLTLNRPH